MASKGTAPSRSQHVANVLKQVAVQPAHKTKVKAYFDVTNAVVKAIGKATRDHSLTFTNKAGETLKKEVKRGDWIVPSQFINLLLVGGGQERSSLLFNTQKYKAIPKTAAHGQSRIHLIQATINQHGKEVNTGPIQFYNLRQPEYNSIASDYNKFASTSLNFNPDDGLADYAADIFPSIAKGCGFKDVASLLAACVAAGGKTPKASDELYTILMVLRHVLMLTPINGEGTDHMGQALNYLAQRLARAESLDTVFASSRQKHQVAFANVSLEEGDICEAFFQEAEARNMDDESPLFIEMTTPRSGASFSTPAVDFLNAVSLRVVAIKHGKGEKWQMTNRHFVERFLSSLDGKLIVVGHGCGRGKTTLTKSEFAIIIEESKKGFSISPSRSTDESIDQSVLRINKKRELALHMTRKSVLKWLGHHRRHAAYYLFHLGVDARHALPASIVHTVLATVWDAIERDVRDATDAPPDLWEDFDADKKEKRKKKPKRSISEMADTPDDEPGASKKLKLKEDEAGAEDESMVDENGTAQRWSISRYSTPEYLARRDMYNPLPPIQPPGPPSQSWPYLHSLRYNPAASSQAFRC